MKHTPGPWEASERGDYSPLGGIEFISVQGDDKKVSEVYEEGDASLIAAAPDMLEALESLSLVVGLTAFKHEGQREPLQEAYDQASAAIAKAKGE